MPINVNQLRSELGAYFAFHQELLADQLMRGYETAAHFRTVFSEAQADNEVGVPNSQLSEVVQNFQPVVTRKGNMNFGAHKVTMRRHKINVGIDPDELVGEWLGNMYQERSNRRDMPITRYTANKVLTKVDEDREEQMIYKGIYVAPTTGTPSPASESVDGLGRVIANGISAGTIAPFAMGAPTASTMFEYVEQFLVNLPGKHRLRRLKLGMSETMLLWYQQDKRNTFNYRLEASELLKVDFSKIEMVALPSMEGRNRMWCTVPGNLVRMIHQLDGVQNLQVRDDDPYMIDLIADWHECYGIADHRYFWCTDVN